MIELSEHNVQSYLRSAGRVSPAHELLIQPLSGGVAGMVLKIFDPGAGPRLGTDLRSPAQIKRGVADTRASTGACFVIKQPRAKFATAAEWLVDTDRVRLEHNCLTLLAQLLPAGSVPEVLWFDEANNVLAISCAPTDAVLWKKELLAGRASRDAATHAGMLLAMLHSSTAGEQPVAQRYGDPRLFIQQRTDPYLNTAAARHPALAPRLKALAKALLETQLCLIHGDFSPKNIFLVPEPTPATPPGKAALSHLLLLDFEVAFYGHPAFDVATLINHLLLKGFYHRGRWRGFMLAADAFWQTYSHTAHKALVAAAGDIGGHVLGALLLARIDGKSPVEYITDAAQQDQVRRAASALLQQPDASLDYALDAVSMYFDAPE